MRTGLLASDIGATAVVLACCWLVLQRFASDRWKRRFRAIESPLIASPRYRALFLLVVVGVLLICVLPEAAFVLPAVDAVGLDIVTIFAALELRHYLASVVRVLGIPINAPVGLRVSAQVVRRLGNGLRVKTALYLYACAWSAIWFRTWAR